MTTLHSFNFTYGGYPNSIIQTRDLTLFGATPQGGFSQRGVIFRSSTAGTYSAVHMFPGTDPLFPVSNMVAGPDGALYGSSCAGGAFNAGTVFRLTPEAAALTVLHSFAYWDGLCPSGGLALGTDGALYGAAKYYGLGGGGTLFRITTAGAFTPLHFFSGPDGWQPAGGLVRASDGQFYGTTLASSQGGGTIFRATATGGFTSLFRGTGSVAALMQASDGNLYGSAAASAFRMTLAGAVTIFDPGIGVNQGSFVQGPDGNLYGTTWNGGSGPDYVGALFRMTLGGTMTALHAFTGADGAGPLSGLLLTPDGTFFGSTSRGGASDRGTLFQFFGTGAPVTIHHFNGIDGQLPFANLTLGTDGRIYGSALLGGRGGRGVLFRLRRP